jgi:hypothetical protein
VGAGGGGGKGKDDRKQNILAQLGDSYLKTAPPETTKLPFSAGVSGLLPLLL